MVYKSLANAKRFCGCSVLCLPDYAVVRTVRTTGALFYSPVNFTG